jgi:hypothetical protein
MNGLHCNIYRAADFPDCTNSGVTGSSVGHKHITLIGDGVKGPFEPSDDSPALWLEYDLEPKGARAGQLTVATPAWLRELGAQSFIRGGCSEFECMGTDWASKHQIVRVVARPLNKDGTPRTGGMFGGNYIESSDSRFPTTAPIPVHDRFE